MKKLENKILNILAFCILMENNKGILNKSPEYIMEKYRKYINGHAYENNYEWGLDKNNKEKLKKYIEKWIKK